MPPKILGDAARRNPVGTHVEVGTGLVNGTPAGARAEALRICNGNPRGWALAQGDPAVDAAFRAGCEEDGIRVFIHAPYLVNFGAEGVVVHTGSSAVDGSYWLLLEPTAGQGHIGVGAFGDIPLPKALRAEVAARQTVAV